jgi:hypothetical protein
MIGGSLGRYSQLPRDEKEISSRGLPLETVPVRQDGYSVLSLCKTIYVCFIHLLVLLLAGLLLKQHSTCKSTGYPLLKSELRKSHFPSR